MSDWPWPTGWPEVLPRPLYSPACPACGAEDEWHYDSHNDEYLCEQWDEQ
jgi:hypothetical protein